MTPCTVTMQGVDSRALCINNKKGDWLPCTVSVREMSHIKLEGGLIPMHCDSEGEISWKMRRGIDSHAVSATVQGIDSHALWQWGGGLIEYEKGDWFLCTVTVRGRSYRIWEGGLIPMQCDSAGDWFPCTVTVRGRSYRIWEGGLIPMHCDSEGRPHRKWEGGLIPMHCDSEGEVLKNMRIGIDSYALWQWGGGLTEYEKGNWFPCTVTVRGGLIENEKGDWFPCTVTVRGGLIENEKGGLIPVHCDSEGRSYRIWEGGLIPMHCDSEGRSYRIWEGGLIPVHCDSEGEVL